MAGSTYQMYLITKRETTKKFLLALALVLILLIAKFISSEPGASGATFSTEAIFLIIVLVGAFTGYVAHTYRQIE
jgi:hypothetical protein